MITVKEGLKQYPHAGGISHVSLNGYSGRQCDGDPFGERRGLGVSSQGEKVDAGQTAQFCRVPTCLQAAWLLIPQLRY